MNGGLHNPRPVDDVPMNGQLEHGVTSNWAYDHSIDIDAHMEDMLSQCLVGQYFFGESGFHSAGMALAINTLFAVPFYVVRTMTFDRIGFYANGDAGVGSLGRCGIYADNGNLYPGALVVDGGVIDLDDAGVKAAVIDQQLTKGLYYKAILVDTDPTPRCHNVHVPPLGSASPQLLNINTLYSVAFGYAALPAAFPGGAALGSIGTREAPSIGLRVASLD